MEKILDIYTDYLISSFGQSTATGLSGLLNGEVSHDKITRFLSAEDFSGKDLWKRVKPLVREHEKQDACLIFDDTIIEKEYTDENGIVCWHWGHSKGRNVKGINMPNAFYHAENDRDTRLRIPTDFKIIQKTEKYHDQKTKKQKRKSKMAKNEMFRDMFGQGIENALQFRYVPADSWFCSSENMEFIDKKGKYFIFDMKCNRNVCLSERNRDAGLWTKMNDTDIPENTPLKVWLKSLNIPVLLVKQALTNKDASKGVRFPVSNDFSMSSDGFETLCKKRGGVEEYHKSLKQNAPLGSSPTRTVTTQPNHIFASIMAYVKLERLKLAHGLNHFAMKSKIHLEAVKVAFEHITRLKEKIQTA